MRYASMFAWILKAPKARAYSHVFSSFERAASMNTKLYNDRFKIIKVRMYIDAKNKKKSTHRKQMD